MSVKGYFTLEAFISEILKKLFEKTGVPNFKGKLKQKTQRRNNLATWVWRNFNQNFSQFMIFVAFTTKINEKDINTKKSTKKKKKSKEKGTQVPPTQL